MKCKWCGQPIRREIPLDEHYKHSQGWVHEVDANPYCDHSTLSFPYVAEPQEEEDIQGYSRSDLLFGGNWS